MNLRSFRHRILASAVLTALLGTWMVAMTVRITVRRNLPAAPDAVTPALVQACDGDPTGRGRAVIGPAQLVFYDRDGRPVDGVGDALPPAWLDELQREGVVTAVQPPPRVVMAVEGHRCHYAAVADRRGTMMRTVVTAGLASGAFLAVLAVGLLTFQFTVRPLLQRIERLRRSALDVGSDSYRSTGDDVPDALGQIGDVLDRSHGRIQADRAELVSRHLALEQHMAELAHDLRTPLASLLLAVQETLAGADERSGAHDAARRALDEATYVATLVDNLHHGTRLRHGLDVHAADIDLVDLVRRLEVRFRALGRAAGVEVAAAVPEHPVVVQAEPTLVERAVGNLLHNAVRHGGAHVAVRLWSEDAGFGLSIVDDGDELPLAVVRSFAHRTFLDDPVRPRDGGLGLVITNEVVRRLGWSVLYAAGDGGRGVSVTLTGPLVASSHDDPA